MNKDEWAGALAALRGVSWMLGLMGFIYMVFDIGITLAPKLCQ